MKLTPSHRGVAAIVARRCLAAGGGVTVTRGPYLQMPTPAEHDRALAHRRRRRRARCRTARRRARSAQTVDDAALDHRARRHARPVSRADTQYYYSVGAIGGALAGDDADHFFRTAPTTGTAEPFRIWTIGDAGFTGANLDAVRDAYRHLQRRAAPTDLFLLLGDNAYLVGHRRAVPGGGVRRARRDAAHDAGLVGRSATTRRFSSNSLTQTGPYFDMFSFPTAGEAGGVASGTESYYSFDYGNVHFIVLDSEQSADGRRARRCSPGSRPICRRRTRRLDRSRSGTARRTARACSTTPTSRRHEIAHARSTSLPILENYGVDLVLSGHSHSYERSYLLDGHYGLSATFSTPPIRSTPATAIRPATAPTQGRRRARSRTPARSTWSTAAAARCASTTLNHPAMMVGLLELGSVVIDIDGDDAHRAIPQQYRR